MSRNLLPPDTVDFYSFFARTHLGYLSPIVVLCSPKHSIFPSNCNLLLSQAWELRLQAHMVDFFCIFVRVLLVYLRRAALCFFLHLGYRLQTQLIVLILMSCFLVLGISQRDSHPTPHSPRGNVLPVTNIYDRAHIYCPRVGFLRLIILTKLKIKVIVVSRVQQVSTTGGGPHVGRQSKFTDVSSSAASVV